MENNNNNNDSQSNSEDIKQKAGYRQHASPFIFVFRMLGGLLIKCIES